MLPPLWPILAALALASQSQAPEFEVASVKPSPPLDSQQAALRRTPMAERIGIESPGRINYPATSLKTLLARAYGLRPYQISGPKWLDTEFYDIVAKLPAETTREQLRLMLQRLLTERFGIESHRETRQTQIYVLTEAKGGSKLKAAEPVSSPLPSGRNIDSPPSQASREAEQKARLAAVRANLAQGFNRSLTLPNSTLADFAQELSWYMNAPVSDQTRIEGKYNFDLKWSADDALPDGSDAAISAPFLFSAIQKQLGLKLEASKGPLSWLVVDRAEKTPTGN